MMEGDGHKMMVVMKGRLHAIKGGDTTVSWRAMYVHAHATHVHVCAGIYV